MSQRHPQTKNCNRVASSEGSSLPVSRRLPQHTPVLIWNPVTGPQYFLGPVQPVACSQIYPVMQVEEMPSQWVTFHPGDAGRPLTNHGQRPTAKYLHARLPFGVFTA